MKIPEDKQEKTMIALLLVDYDPLLRQGLRSWLERVPDITVVGEASTDTEAITLAHTLQPDVVLIDFSMSTTDGIVDSTGLRALAPRSAVVLLSLYDDATMRERAQAAGTTRVVGKQEGIKALLAAIQEAATHGRQLSGVRNDSRRNNASEGARQ